MKHKARQFELGWKEEAFTLAVETAPDWQRIQAEQAQAEKDRAEQQSKHLDLFTENKSK